jgi:hypothetical protein
MPGQVRFHAGVTVISSAVDFFKIAQVGIIGPKWCKIKTTVIRKTLTVTANAEEDQLVIVVSIIERHPPGGNINRGRFHS